MRKGSLPQPPSGKYNIENLPDLTIIENGAPRCQYDSNCKNSPTKPDAFCKMHKKLPFKTKLSGSEPSYMPNLWNDDPFLQKVHNCFAYALNILSKQLGQKCKRGICNTHQPGEYSKWLPMNDKSCPNLIGRILGDDSYNAINYEDKCPIGTSMVAFIIDTERDYHVLRLDKNNYFSHKGGQGPVTDKDAQGHRIADVRLANFDYSDKPDKLKYNHFCGYFCISRSKVHAEVSRGGMRFRKTRHAKQKQKQKQNKTRLLRRKTDT